MTSLVLKFIGGEQPELSETLFKHPLLVEARRCIRGKTSGAYFGYSTFQWTRGTQALSRLIAMAKLQSVSGGVQSSFEPNLVGFAQSHAASLDYAIDKKTAWLFEMFGWDSKGGALARRLIQRTNPNRKRAGPVALSVNTRVLNPVDIGIFLDGAPVTTVAGLTSLLEGLAATEFPDGLQQGCERVAA